MSISQDLSITVFGRAGTGKTTITQIIANALKEAGIDVVVRDEDTLPEAIITGQPARVERLAERLQGQVIEIKQVQLPRGRA